MTGHLDIIYAEKLRRLRTEKNDKQEATAMDLGISQRDYSDLENGRSHFTEEMIKKICLAFKLSPAAFRKIEKGPALTDFLKTLAEQGIVGEEKETGEIDLEILMYKKTIRELQYEKMKLLWELRKTNASADKLWPKPPGNIYVII